jgi:hypothetical protein
MNIVKLQEELRNVPLNNLIQYINSPSGQVPSYLALAEIKRRKDMEQRYAAQSNQAPETTVVDELTQPQSGGVAMLAGNPMGNPAPQGASANQGVAGLPIPDQMFSGKSMAAGGIVAFDDGGDVAASDTAPSDMAPSDMAPMTADITPPSTAPSYADMSYDELIASGVHPMNAAALKGMSPSPASYGRMRLGATAGPSPAPLASYGSDMTDEMMRVSPEAFRYSYGVGRGTSPYAGAAYSSIRKEMGSPGYADGGMIAFDGGGPVATSKLGDFFRGLGNRGATDIDKQLGALQAEKNKISYDIFSSYTPEQRATQQQRLAAIDAQIAALTEQRSSTANMPKVEKPALAAPGLAGLNTTPAADNKLTNEDIANLEAYRKQGTPRSEVMTTKPVADVTSPMAGPAPIAKEAGIESLLEDTGSLAEKKMARYKQMIGEDPERAKLEDLTRKYETGAAEQERMAPWMALTKAGFAMAGGKSPFAIQNISEGAQAGLADYVQAKDKLDKLTEKQIDIRSKMQQARRAEDIAATTYGLNSEAAVEARNAQVKLKDLEEKNAFNRTKYAADVSTKNAMIAAAKKSDYETFIDLAKQDDDNYKTVKDKDGTIKKVFDAGKVTQTYKAFGPSGSTDKEFLEQYERLSMLNADFKKKYPTAADYVLDQRAKLSGTSAPTASSSSWGPLKVK